MDTTPTQIRSFRDEKEKIRQVTRGIDAIYPSTKLIIHPFSIRLTHGLAKAGVSPNTVTVVAAFISALCMLAFWGGYEIAALFLFWARYVLDYVDGALARYSGKESKLGASLDLYADYVFYGGMWVLFAVKLGSPGVGAFAIAAALLYVLVGDHYVWPRRVKLERREPIKQFFMDRGILIGFAPFGIYELWCFVFFAVGIPFEYFIVLPSIVCADLVYRVYEVVRYGKG